MRDNYEGKFPESEYSIYMDKISGTNEIAPGTPFNDFSANDIEGKIVKSDVTADEVRDYLKGLYE